MIRVVLTGPNGDRYQVDAPDPSFIGPWLKAIFDTFGGTPGPGPIPVRFTIDIG